MPENKPNQCNERFLQWKSSNTPLFTHLLFIVCFHGKCICGVYVCALKGSLYGHVQAGQPWVVFTLILRQDFSLNLELTLGWLVNKLQGFSRTTSPPQPLEITPIPHPAFTADWGCIGEATLRFCWITGAEDSNSGLQAYAAGILLTKPPFLSHSEMQPFSISCGVRF